MRWMGRTFATGVWLVALAGGASPMGWGAASIRVAAPVVRTGPVRVVAGSAAVAVSTQRETNPGSRRESMPVRREVHRITGWLHTVGTDIVDARGRVVRFAGV